ncbi:MAG: exo-alpha-sialidase [Armatimonadetes bacterium]|nr:exo-alpha-sialidase [Armatimonadota bacterium]
MQQGALHIKTNPQMYLLRCGQPRQQQTPARDPANGNPIVRQGHLMMYDGSATARTPLSVAVSTDAEHWSPVMDLESGPGEYSYPAVIQTRDGLVHVTYTWRRERIRHVVIDPTSGSRG